ncbi:MAG: hypothetical protein Q4D62_06200 [Planctomycetia bacterium]|nr:hypothetical protein [Planctomycetia bacterium]
MRYIQILVTLFFLTSVLTANDWATTGKGGSAGNLTTEEIQQAWAEMPRWNAGTDAKALFAMDWIVIRATSDPATRQATAGRLAELLKSPETTASAKKFILAKLYQIGTESEVAAVVPFLNNPETVDDARLFLERIGTAEARQGLREAAGKLEGRALIGVMNSLSLLEDADFLETLSGYTTSADKAVALAAWRALGNYGSDAAGRLFLRFLQAEKGKNVPLESGAIRCAILLKERGNAYLAEAILDQMTFSYRGEAARQAGWQARWDAMSEADQKKLAQEWKNSPETAKRWVAYQVLMKQDFGRSQEGKGFPEWLKSLESDNVQAEKEAVSFFLTQPKDAVGGFLLQELQGQKIPSKKIVDLLARLKYYNAIDTLVNLARKGEPEIYEVAISGLRGICDADEPDLERVLKLYLDVQDVKQKDLISRTIAAIAEKNPEKARRADILLGFIEKDGRKAEVAFQAEVLPMLGRLGTAKVFEKVEVARKSEQEALQNAAWQALCNWPNAEHADLLWERAAAGDSAALRAYIRVITIPSERSAEAVLADLQKAFAKADSVENRQLALARASAVRCKETVAWAATFLDDEALSQVACQTIVELAHHRFLRQPNKAFFEPILEKVKAVSKDAEIQQRAEKARLGM